MDTHHPPGADVNLFQAFEGRKAENVVLLNQEAHDFSFARKSCLWELPNDQPTLRRRAKPVELTEFDVTFQHLIFHGACSFRVQPC